MHRKYTIVSWDGKTVVLHEAVKLERTEEMAHKIADGEYVFEDCTVHDTFHIFPMANIFRITEEPCE